MGKQRLRGGNLPKVTKVISGRAKVQTPIYLPGEPLPTYYL